MKDSTRKAQKRALEPSDESLYSQEQDRACKDKRRESETVVKTTLRREHDRACKAKTRESETVVETAQRREQNRACMAKKKRIRDCGRNCTKTEAKPSMHGQKKSIGCSMEKYITDLVKQGPEFVCTCCHRLMYKQTVIPCTKSKYTKANCWSKSLVLNITTLAQMAIKLWVCKTCDAASWHCKPKLMDYSYVQYLVNCLA